MAFTPAQRLAFQSQTEVMKSLLEEDITMEQAALVGTVVQRVIANIEHARQQFYSQSERVSSENTDKGLRPIIENGSTLRWVLNGMNYSYKNYPSSDKGIDRIKTDLLSLGVSEAVGESIMQALEEHATKRFSDYLIKQKTPGR
ncbi:MAG: hypothetical protein KGI29_05850 [Pseudomonadota bacterium]|nr:hypothetical protein [Pseudomonadota bacterium]